MSYKQKLFSIAEAVKEMHAENPGAREKRNVENLSLAAETARRMPKKNAVLITENHFDWKNQNDDRFKKLSKNLEKYAVDADRKSRQKNLNEEPAVKTKLPRKPIKTSDKNFCATRTAKRTSRKAANAETEELVVRLDEKKPVPHELPPPHNYPEFRKRNAELSANKIKSAREAKELKNTISN
ncbi:uncharacterized protein LOC119687491 [Teleopsis dalmanni]|uniref:uncharacterized protein LOC119687491 n=1 Tax=Teleopsis dalmanni TaxID=139649 RepID=UPI0018CFEB05|nr:uncharacterized protein LOC119687491 [Teleopsis dalmanni]